MLLRLWSDLYLIQGRYIVFMGTPNKTSSLSILNGLDVYPSLYGSSPLMSNRIFPLRRVLTSFVLPVHNLGAGNSSLTGSCPLKIIPASYQLILCTFITVPNTLALLQHLSVDASCNNISYVSETYAALGCVPGCLISPSIFDAS